MNNLNSDHSEKYFVYVLKSELFPRYYIGQTKNIEERISRHQAGVEKSTSPFRPWILVCSIIKKSRSEAMILERKLKNLNVPDLAKFIAKYGIASTGREV